MPSAAPVRHLLSGCSHSSHDREDLDRSDASKQSTATAAACPDCDGSGPCDGNGAHVTGATPGTFSHSGGAWATNRHALESCGWDSDSVGAPGLSRAGSGGSLAFSSGSWDQYAAMDDLHPGDESPDAAAVRHQARMLVSEQAQAFAAHRRQMSPGPEREEELGHSPFQSGRPRLSPGVQREAGPKQPGDDAPLPPRIWQDMPHTQLPPSPGAGRQLPAPMNCFAKTSPRGTAEQGPAMPGPTPWPKIDPLVGHPRYQRLGDISRGSSGFVLLALDRQTGQQVAIKFIPTGAAFKEASIQRELTNQAMCSGHPHIVQLLDVFALPDYLAIVMEFANCSDLAAFISSYVTRHGRGLEEKEARRLLQQLLVALQFVHDKGIANRDIKLDNILLHMDPASPGAPVIKLCDFGFSKNERNSLSKTSCGTPEYIAPEVLSVGKYDGKKADVWGCGVVLYVLLAGAFPFLLMGEEALPPLQRLTAMMPRIMSGTAIGLPDPVTAACGELLRGLLVPNPARRATLGQALHHPWLTTDLPLDLAIMNMRLQGIPGSRAPPKMPPQWMQAVAAASASSLATASSRLHALRQLQAERSERQKNAGPSGSHSCGGDRRAADTKVDAEPLHSRLPDPASCSP